MKYLAILRDSFLEALDSKVIYVLVALSLLVTLFMLSISFTPAGVQPPGSPSRVNQRFPSGPLAIPYNGEIGPGTGISVIV